MSKEQAVSIDGKQYVISSLPKEAQVQLGNLRATDAEIAHLKHQLLIAQTAKQVFVAALKRAMPAG